MEHIESLAELHRTHIVYHHLLFTRLYRLTQTAIANGYTKAAWPVWRRS